MYITIYIPDICIRKCKDNSLTWDNCFGIHTYEQAMSTKSNGKMKIDMALENIRLSMELFTKGNGEIIKIMVLANIHGLMVMSTRANGKTTFALARER